MGIMPEGNRGEVGSSGRERQCNRGVGVSGWKHRRRWWKWGRWEGGYWYQNTSAGLRSFVGGLSNEHLQLAELGHQGAGKQGVES